jgi:drug/metabolite transporter (DMT)-like permease
MTFPSATNITRPYMLMQHVDVLTNGAFGLVLLIAIFVIALISTKNFRATASFATASFITMIMSLLLRAMEAVSDMIMIACIVLAAIGMAFIFFEGKWN